MAVGTTQVDLTSKVCFRVTEIPVPLRSTFTMWVLTAGHGVSFCHFLKDWCITMSSSELNIVAIISNGSLATCICPLWIISLSYILVTILRL